MSRDQIVRRFEQWLDETLAVEAPPAGVDAELLATLDGTAAPSNGGAEPADDAYTLWAAMVALTQEVRLQGRAFKELHTTLDGEAGRMAEEVRAAYRERERDAQREAERRCHREVLGALIEMRDRLGRGLQSARVVEAGIVERTRRGWLSRIFPPSAGGAATGALSAVLEGYELGIERLDQTLHELNVREIRCEGQPFDPHRMSAIAREASSVVAEGTVLEVYRSGYEWGAEVFRPAQVKVACAPVAGQHHD
jgi:molecular chaperone GrpE